MDPGQAPRPRLRLILDHTINDAESTPTVWNPEDELYGHLELSSVEDLRINDITIYFEGELQTANRIMDVKRLLRRLPQLDKCIERTPPSNPEGGA